MRYSYREQKALGTTNSKHREADGGGKVIPDMQCRSVGCFEDATVGIYCVKHAKDRTTKRFVDPYLRNRKTGIRVVRIAADGTRKEYANCGVAGSHNHTTASVVQRSLTSGELIHGYRFERAGV